MAHHPKRSLYTVLGLVAWGDLGPLTIYRSKRGQVVAFAKTWPHKPPSEAQTAQRQKFTDAAAAWQAFTADQRAQWETASRRASLCCSGYCLYVHWHLTADTKAIRTIERHTRTTLLPP